MIFFVKQYLKFIDCGVKPAQAFENLKEMGYDRNRRSLYYHVKSYKETGRAVKEDTGSRGSKRKLDADQEDLVRAEVDACNSENRKTNHRKLIKFIQESMDVEVSLSTVKRIEKRVNLSKRKLTKRCRNVKHTPEELAVILWDWILLHKQLKTWSRPLAEIFSYDVTSTKPPEEEFTLAVKGSGKQRSQTKVTVNTDAIVTIIAGSPNCPQNTT